MRSREPWQTPHCVRRISRFAYPTSGARRSCAACEPCLAAACYSARNTAGEVRYALTDGARHFVIVPLRAAQCEWRRATPTDRALTGRSAGSAACVWRPWAAPGQHASGTCQWHVDATEDWQTDVYLAVASGKIAALTAAPVTAPQVVSHATPQVWCEALLHGDPSMIATTGDYTLLNAVFGAMSSALLA